MTFDEACSEASGCLDDHSPGFALESLGRALGYPAEPGDEANWRRAASLLERVFVALDRPAVAGLARQVAADPVNVDALHQFGSALISERRSSIAATVLTRAYARAPDRLDVLGDLVAALETEGRYEDARRFLAAAPSSDFLIRYLLTFNTLMTGDHGEARRLSVGLSPATADEQFMRDRFVQIFSRLDAIQGVTRLDTGDLRGWHFALTGGLLLHTAPPGMGEQGRYLAIEDSEALCLEGLRRLSAVFEVWEVGISRILAFENPESHRLGLAAGEVFGASVKSVLVPDEDGLFVGYDLGAIIPEVLSKLRPLREGWMVYSHAAQWTVEQPLASDFTALQYASIVNPWNRHLIFPARPDLPTGPPTENDDELAGRILQAELPSTALDDLPELLALAAAGRDWAAALRRDGTRERQWVGARNT